MKYWLALQTAIVTKNVTKKVSKLSLIACTIIIENGKFRKSGGMRMEILRASHLCKTYGKGENEVRALDDVSFFNRKGRVCCNCWYIWFWKVYADAHIRRSGSSRQRNVYMDGQDIYKQNDEQLAIFRRRQVGLIYQFIINSCA